MLALNFYSPMVADQLRHRRKTATIRLGDKSVKYKKGLVVAVLAGQRFNVRERIFDAVIDKVEVKPLREVSPREIQHDNPEIRHIEEFVTFLGQLYNRDVSEEDTVTVIHFSEIAASRGRDSTPGGGTRAGRSAARSGSGAVLEHRLAVGHEHFARRPARPAARCSAETASGTSAAASRSAEPEPRP